MASWSHVYQGVVVPVSILIPIAAAINAREINGVLKTIFIYILFAGTINIIAAFMAFNYYNNLPLLHIYTILELILLLRFFSRILKNKAVLKVIKIITWVFPLMCMINFSFFESIYTFNSYTRPLEAIIIIILCMIHLKDNEELFSVSSAQAKPEIWISIGLLIYFSGSFFQFTFSNYISHLASPAIKSVIWNLHATLVLLMYIFFTKAFIRAKINR